MRMTLANAKDSTLSNIAAVANLSTADPRFIQKINEAQQRLIQTGEMFYGLFQRIQFCLDAGCLVLPRQIASVESVALCDHPIPVRNRWFEFLDGVGLAGDGVCGAGECGPNQLRDRGEVCAFADIIGLDKKIKVYADTTEAADAVILLLGYDENNIWIRTQVSGTWIDGEQVSLSGGPHTSTKLFTSLTGVQKPITNGTVRLYEYDTTLTTQRAIAIYEPDETNPSYRKMFINGMDGSHCCDCTGDEASPIQVTVMAKLEFIPARQDADWLLISNLPALKDEIQSIMKYENNLPQEGAFWHAKAISTLRAETRHLLGHGAVNPMRMAPRNVAGAGVLNMQ
jgi:hypothetical protein